MCVLPYKYRRIFEMLPNFNDVMRHNEEQDHHIPSTQADQYDSIGQKISPLPTPTPATNSTPTSIDTALSAPTTPSACSNSSSTRDNDSSYRKKSTLATNTETCNASHAIDSSSLDSELLTSQDSAGNNAVTTLEDEQVAIVSFTASCH